MAKIVSSGTVYIRAYGTFPHPNLLSAFLLTTILINIYLLTSTTWKNTSPFAKASGDEPLKNNKGWFKIWLNLALFINILGLTATFSRGSFLALGIGLLVYFGFFLLKSPPLNLPPQGGENSNSLPLPQWYRWGLRGRDRVGWVIIIVISYCLISFGLFRPFLLSRATVSDQAVVERGIYNQTALNMIKDKPIFGLGIGESVLHMEQYLPRTNFDQSRNIEKDASPPQAPNTDKLNSEKLVRDGQPKLNPWQIQPIHNYFLLSFAELGIPGALILIWIFLSHLKAISHKLKADFDSYYLLLTTLLLTFLVLMLFDHYFYTLEQTQALLWIVLGLIAAETQTRLQSETASYSGQVKNLQTGDL